MEGRLGDVFRTATRQLSRPRSRARPVGGSMLIAITHRIFATLSRVLHIGGLH